MTYLGIDPGASGAMCILEKDNNPLFVDFKKEGIKGYSTALRALLAKNTELVIAVEKVASMSGQGVKSMFSFGQRLGELHGMLQTLGLEWQDIRPQAWQKALGVIPKSGKKGIFEKVSALCNPEDLVGPRGGIIDGRADALGIANYLKRMSNE